MIRPFASVGPEEIERALHVAHCPVGREKDAPSHWRSEPLRNVVQAVEALRKHLSEHTHGELVEHAMAKNGIEVTTYIPTHKEGAA